MNYLDRLNDKQREAVFCTEGPLLVLAGAGSGKTSMMTSRIAYLIEQKRVSPYNILAVTFTNKAAGEMRERVAGILDTLELGVDVRSMWIQTFHSACLRLLRVHADLVGYGNDFVVYDMTDQKTVVKNLCKSLNVPEKMFTPAYILSVISECKEKAISPQEYAMANVQSSRSMYLTQIYKGYVAELKKNNAMDFDDLLLNAVKVLEENDDVLYKYQSRFRYIMVDEYQDTNYIQYRFVQLLAQEHKNICVVGDDDQCIYEWRGADISNILGFEKNFYGAKVIKLEQNYRSSGNILNAANSVIAKNKTRKAKTLWTSKDDGELIKYALLGNERDEATYIAKQIEALKGTRGANGEPLCYGDFAVLYRTNAQSRIIEEIMRLSHIPAKVVGNVGFYDRKEIKDVLAYLRLVQNPLDDVSFERIINEPKRGVGEKTLEKLRALAKLRGESLLQLLCDTEVRAGFSAKVHDSLTRLTDMLIAYGHEKDNLDVIDIYDGVLAKSGYLTALTEQNTVEAEGRIENILELRSAIEQFQNENPEGKLIDFLEGKALAADSDKLPDEKEQEEKDEVLLMTVHTAKGLEFPVVFLPGLEQGLFPGARAVETLQGLEEERRLCYVAMTRAKERLFMTSANVRTLYGKTNYNQESVFLSEIGEKFIDGELNLKKKQANRIADGYGKSRPMQRPFDSLKYAKQDVMQKKSSASTMEMTVGERVSHKKFGVGTIAEIDEKTVVVIFDGEGRKKLLRDVAPLVKL